MKFNYKRRNKYSERKKSKEEALGKHRKRKA
jgi:hypothetical protein